MAPCHQHGVTEEARVAAARQGNGLHRSGRPGASEGSLSLGADAGQRYGFGSVFPRDEENGQISEPRTARRL